LHSKYQNLSKVLGGLVLCMDAVRGPVSRICTSQV